MKCTWRAGPMLMLLMMAMPAASASDNRVEDLALCRDSWLDWKSTAPAKLESLGAYFRSDFTHSAGEAFITPKSAMTIHGMTVTQVYPGSLGMGLGFSVLVEAPFDAAKQVMDREVGTELRECETGEGMRTCALPIAEQRTFMMVSGDPPNDKTTLLGCYYYYEK